MARGARCARCLNSAAVFQNQEAPWSVLPARTLHHSTQSAKACVQEKTQLSRQRAVLEQQLGRMHERIDHLESEREHSLQAAEEEGALAAALLRYVAIAVPGVAPHLDSAAAGR